MSEVKVTLLPPGEALGARDLQRWALRRVKGQSGVRPNRRERKALAEWKKQKFDAADRWLARREPDKIDPPSRDEAAEAAALANVAINAPRYRRAPRTQDGGFKKKADRAFQRSRSASLEACATVSTTSTSAGNGVKKSVRSNHRSCSP
jgi:hypothetical protein